MTHGEFHRRFQQGLLANDQSSIMDLLRETSHALVSPHIHGSVNDTWVEQVWKFFNDVLAHNEACEVFYLNGGFSRICARWNKGKLAIELTDNSSEKAKRVWNAENATTP